MKPVSTVLVCGGSGLIGTHLCNKLTALGYQIKILSRTGNPQSSIPVYTWNPEKKEIDTRALENVDYIINLSGTNIGEKRWTKRRKQLIISSRTETAGLLFDKIKENKNVLKAYISASGINYYGTTDEDRIFKETDPPGNDFLGSTCLQWEKAADQFSKLDVRTVKLRCGVVLSHRGGALDKMLVPVKMGIASAIGFRKTISPLDTY